MDKSAIISAAESELRSYERTAFHDIQLPDGFADAVARAITAAIAEYDKQKGKD